MSDIIFLIVSDVLLLHKKQMSRFGSGNDTIRDQALLESAVFQAQAFAFGTYLHKSIYDMAAAYCYHIIKNHPFIDGNKRTGLLTALTFLGLNNLSIKADAEDLYGLTLGIATTNISKEQIAQFFKDHTIPKT